MLRRSRAILVAEIPGDQYSTLQDAQRAALADTAHDLASTLRGLLARGVLIVQDGKIQPNTQR